VEEIIDQEVGNINLQETKAHIFHAYKEHIVNNLCEECKKGCQNLEEEIDYVINTKLKDKNIVEVKCHGILGNHFCELSEGFNDSIYEGEEALVECDDAVDITKVVEIGNIAKLKLFKYGINEAVLPKLLRKLNEEDYKQLAQNGNDENKAKPIFRSRVEKYNLNMKLVDVHYQFDRKKLFFFYTSDGRVDFRELAKDLASEFKTRIELRQIGVRDEAKRVGGVGTCGREYCCSVFLYNFKKITTQLANDQNANSNMSKLSGPCGKLKCCLSFESE